MGLDKDVRKEAKIMKINKKLNILSLLLTLTIVIPSCSTKVNDLTNKSLLNEKVSNLRVKTSVTGIVKFPDLLTSDKEGAGNYKAKAVLSDITSQAIVALEYPPDYIDTTLRGITVATGLTDSTGVFSINPSATFNPAVNQVFVLEAIKRIGSVGNYSITMRTIVRWNGSTFDSITTPGIYIDSNTTALAILASMGLIASNDTIGQIIVSNGTEQISNITVGTTTVTAAQINSLRALIDQSLANNQDPFASIIYNNGSFALKQSGRNSLGTGCIGEPINCPNFVPSSTPTPSVTPVPTPTPS